MGRALNRPIENLPDENEQTALALIAHLAPSLAPWRQGEDLREESGLLKLQTPGLANDVNAAKQKIVDLELQAAQAFKSADVLLPAILGLIALGFWFKFGIYAAVGGAAGIGFGIYRLLSAKKKIQGQKIDAERVQALKVDEQKKVQQRLSAIDAELRGRDGGFPQITVAKVGFQIRRATIVGSDTLMDMSGLASQVELSTVDLSKVGTHLKVVSDDAKSLANVPILLAPNSEMKTSDAVERLYGEEDRLRLLVNGFVDTLSKVEDIKIRLPLVPAQSELAKRMASTAQTEVSDQGLVLVQTEVADINRVAGFVAQVNAAKTVGERVLTELRETYQALSDSCDAYSNARLSSVNHLHSQLFDVLNRASWCSKRFYCPRTIQSPVYLQALLQIDIEQAHTMPFEALASRLESDSVIARRVKEKPEILDLLWNSYRAVVDFEPPSSSSNQSSRSGPAGPSPHLQDQYEELLKQFRLALLKAITGSPNPVLAFSSEAQLFYDPETEEWRSDVVPYRYSTTDIQRFGQVLKVHTDVLFPLWEHLWTEKADFRKAELFRTNDSLTRMTEKESEKLIEIGNQFRADMRPVRENVYLIESELSAKGDELRQFRDAMNDLGVLSERQMKHLSNDYLKHLTLGDGSVLKRAEEIESWLAFEPKSQAERRGGIRDPIDIARAPDVLIGYSDKDSHSPRLPVSGINQ